MTISDKKILCHEFPVSKAVTHLSIFKYNLRVDLHLLTTQSGQTVEEYFKCKYPGKTNIVLPGPTVLMENTD